MDRRTALFLASAFAACASTGWCQTAINGSTFALRSSGTTSGTTSTLTQDGYFGTYVTLGTPGPITFTANASGVAGSGINPDMTISIADYSQSFSVGSSASNYACTTPSLPAGTYFVRTQLDNDKTQVLGGSAVTPSGMSLTLNNLTVSGNAAVSNSGTDDSLALAASNTYIDNFRKGSATIHFTGAAVGDSVHVKLINNAFKLGTYVSGTSASDSYTKANTADATYFRQFIQGRFNAVVPSNAGKWSYDETVSSTGTSTGTSGMATVDQMEAYAAANDMSARQHNVIWGGLNQTPSNIVSLLNTVTNRTSTGATASFTQSQRTTAYNEVKAAIANRISYYIAGTNSSDSKTRAADFQQLDVLNEALLTGNYFQALGYDPTSNTITTAQSYSGVAAVYKQAQDAVTAAGSSTRLYTNEYNIFQYAAASVTPNPTFSKGATSSGSDMYANWYRNEVESLNNAAITAGATGNVVTGIGAQYYPLQANSGSRGASVMQKALQNLSVEGLPISLTEFGGQPNGGAYITDASQIVDDTIRMMMGTPSADTMMIWGWLNTGTADLYGGGTALVQKNSDGSYSLTAAGVRFEYLFGRGTDPTAPGNVNGVNPDPLTTDLTELVNADGSITFNGFYGEYLVTVDGQQFDLTLNKDGTNTFTLAVPEPAMLSLLCLAPLMRRRARTHA